MIEEIELFIGDIGNYDAFEIDRKTQRAIERCLEIIGESIQHVQWVDEDTKFSNQSKILITCHQIIHNVGVVAPQSLWLISNDYLPTLKEEVQVLLNKPTDQQ